MDGLEWLLVWIVGSFFINIIGLFINFKIPYYKGKWDRNKKSPIYKIEQSSWSQYYSIYKYKIDYDCYNENAFLVLILPFFGWFHFPYYKNGDVGYGKFKKEDIKNIDFEIGVFWETERKKSLDEYYKEIKKEKSDKDILNNLNKDFHKHYNNE